MSPTFVAPMCFLQLSLERSSPSPTDGEGKPWAWFTDDLTPRIGMSQKWTPISQQPDPEVSLKDPEERVLNTSTDHQHDVVGEGACGYDIHIPLGNEWLKAGCGHGLSRSKTGRWG